MMPRATYRFQLHAGFTFADARAAVSYLDTLGISHVYASPITAAAPGSMHGYDVVDPCRINPELGGEAGLRALAADLHARSMGLIIDIVPNHMGVAGDTNAWWLDVLKNGRSSRFAPVFDIDWRERLVLPVLGAPLQDAIDAGEIRLIDCDADGAAALRIYGAVTYPVRPDDPVQADAPERRALSHDPATAQGRANLGRLCARQHYDLIYWRAANDLLNWRRFFSINELAGVRVEDPAVFALTHSLYFDLFAQGLIDGVRIDHVDGLTDPGGYCRHLRDRFAQIAPGRSAYIVVEKILAADEELAQDWSIDGTSGYDFMREASQLLHLPGGIAPLRRFWEQVTGRSADFEAEAVIARRDILAWQFEGQLNGCVTAFHDLAAASDAAWMTRGMLRRAIQGLLAVFPVYRTYGDGQTAPAADARWRRLAAVCARAQAPPGETGLIDWVVDVLAGGKRDHPALAEEAVRRFQQLAAPIAAKGVEDTAFYRHGALLSLNDVGFDPARPTMAIADFHAAMKQRAAHFPRAMLATATHDHKRGEDARARLAVLSAIPEIWENHAARWLDRANILMPGIDGADTYTLLQSLVGAWEGDAGQLLPRLHGWQDKSLREAQLRSSWAGPDEEYEARYRAMASALLADASDAGFLPDFERFMAAIAPSALANSLAQTAMRCLLPGVPDIYQGTEGMDYSMVDPDNRRDVGHDLHARMLREPAGEGTAAELKLQLIARLLGMRRLHPRIFENGAYIPAEVRGPRAGNVLAFTRRYDQNTITCAIAVRMGEALFAGGTPVPSPEWWADTAIVTHAGIRMAAALFSESVVHVE